MTPTPMNPLVRRGIASILAVLAAMPAVSSSASEAPGPSASTPASRGMVAQ